ncbi:LacI family DNA-binding transcriptional regulator [Aneurinibacillus sp. Ricciae_BoGa-3]|uniref:LacI family DNA-binding transcriptional regulator n=1 Tax=Aneurinibacillus sp. Ricciae_BoGa-3 TaxID=3022697 RepID=UPI00233FE251|nr:LacI family DNA-binding transcriptional regulator [Aneurinibacillus sp. Ricciae_BoGa-3]WCK53187.1 LacI family DNA-binding transcriptional regulator [Aneurinibacillus sp. Ricciae_BoGa-3]
MNIKEIAKKAGVSVATVSHVVNKTRYVSTELTERVIKVINESDGQPNFVLRNMKALKSDVILCLVENLLDYFYINIVKGIQSKSEENGYDMVVLNSFNKSLLREYVRLEKPRGIIIIADKNNDGEIFKMKDINIPNVIIGHARNSTQNGSIIIDYYGSAYKAANHVIKNGHERVCFINELRNGYIHNQMLMGYKDALRNNGIPFDPVLVIDLESSNPFGNDIFEDIFITESRPTALLSAGGQATKELLKFFNNKYIKCPDDVSLVSFNEFELIDMVNPAITTVAFDPLQIGIKSVEKLNEKINGVEHASHDTVISSRLTVRNSTQCIGRGPLGEKAESPEVLDLTPSEIDLIRSGSYTAAISFHYSGIAWARLHEKGIKDVFSDLGVKVLAVTDAHFDPELQIKQHASILAMNPDVLISIPADEVLTEQSYREVVNKGVKLVLINNVPNGLQQEDYVSCVSVNERQNGQTAGRILGEYLSTNNKKKIGLLLHGAPFFATKQRDTAVQQVLSEEFPELEIVAIDNFISRKKTFDKCYEMIKNHPEIEGLYVSWDAPAQEALNALRELNREDISIVTADLDSDVALNMAKGGPIKGLSAQRPYEQGRAMALAAANALIGKKIPSFIGVAPYKITRDNLLTGWQDILRERPPKELIKALKNMRGGDVKKEGIDAWY